MFKDITYNTIIQFIGQLCGILSAFLILSLITRNLGEAQYGLYAVVITWMGLLSVIADMGLCLSGLREMSGTPEDEGRITGHVLILKAMNAAIIGLISVGTIYFVMKPSEFRLALTIGLFSLGIVAVKDTLKTVFQAKLKMMYSVIGDSIGSLVALGLTFLAVRSGKGIVYALSAAITGYVVTMIVNYYFSRSLIRIKFIYHHHFGVDIIRKALPLGLSGILALIYFRIDLIMLSWLKPMEDVGIYAAAYKFVELGAMLPVLFLGTAFPVFSRLIKNKDPGLIDLFNKSDMFLNNLAIPFLIGGFILAEPLMNFIASEHFGKSFTVELPVWGIITVNSTAVVLQILLFAIVLMFKGQLNGHLLVANQMQRNLLVINMFLVPGNILLNVLLIPRYSFIGAAASTVICETGALIYTTWLISKKLALTPNFTAVTKPLLACVPMAVLISIIHWHVIGLVLMGVVVYGIGIYWLQGKEAFGIGP